MDGAYPYEKTFNPDSNQKNDYAPQRYYPPR